MRIFAISQYHWILKNATVFLRHSYRMALWLWSIKAWLTLWLTIKIKIKFKYFSNRIDRTYLDFLLKFVLVVFVVVLFHGNNLVSDNLVRFYIRFKKIYYIANMNEGILSAQLLDLMSTDRLIVWYRYMFYLLPMFQFHKGKNKLIIIYDIYIDLNIVNIWKQHTHIQTDTKLFYLSGGVILMFTFVPDIVSNMSHQQKKIYYSSK